MENASITPRLLTVKQAAEYLAVSDDTIYRLARRHQIPCIKVGKLYRFTKESIDAWITQSTVPVTAPETPPERGPKTGKAAPMQGRREWPEGYEPIQPVPRFL